MSAGPTTRMTGIAGWIDDRTRLGPVLGALLHVRVPMTARTFYFGGIALFMFGIQIVTGTLLTLYYKPTPEAAYKSVQFITSDVSFGWLIRSVHHWTANLMILFVALHLVRVFFQAAYKFPREVTWIIGCVLLLVTLGFGFTGYLLPWDQRAYWATVVGTEIAAAVPFVGDALLQFLRGGPDVTGETMSRFFGIHVLVLPLLLGVLVGVHLVLVHQLGLASPKRPTPRVPTPEHDAEPLRPFFPHYLLDEVVAWYFILAVLVVLASLFPAGLEEPADPLVTPAHTKPEWYYLGVYQFLKLVPRSVGILGAIAAVGLLFVWPFLDRNPEVLARRRLLAVGAATLAIVGLVALTVWGYVS
jgi:quinol-cytochrome oxidoreductase complex cytochrome b subunit